jgi:hypothetical protein
MNEQQEPTTIGSYIRQWWRGLDPTTRKRGWVILILFCAFWLAGAWCAPQAVAGLSGQDRSGQSLWALFMGGFSFLWGALKVLGIIEETSRQPHRLWIPLALVMPAAIGGFIFLWTRPANPLYSMQKKVAGFARSQGRIDTAAVAQKLQVTRGVPYATVADKKKRQVRVGLDYAGGEGHVLIAGPTRSGKGLHLTDTLLIWPGPALVVDPKGEQLARTAAWRSQFGPIYCLPGHRLRLADYYRRLLDRDDNAELHAHLMRPEESRESIFAEKAISLFNASGLFAQAKELDPVRVLLDLAESDLAEALAGLELVPAARRHVRIFTNGASPREYREDRFVTSAFGNFTTRLATYQKHVDTIAPPDERFMIDPNWARQNGTIYLTYSLQDLRGVGGVVAAIIAAMLRAHMRQHWGSQMQRNGRERLLVAIDELPAVGLRNVVDYLATAGGYGITLLLYVQSIAQLKELYGPEGTQAILSNCAHQVWYPPAEYETAAAISRLYGMALQPNPVHSSSRGARQHRDRDGRAQTQTNNNQGASWSWQERPALLPSQILALPREQVLVSTRSTGVGPALADQRYVFLGQRLNPIPLFDRLPPPTLLRLPRPVYGERVYTSWRADEASTDGRLAPDGTSLPALPPLTAGDDPEAGLPGPEPRADENDRDMGDVF